MSNFLTRHFDWLSPHHPLATRESRRLYQELPPFIRKLTDPWSLLGYAALLHGMLFVMSLFSYNRISRAFPNMMLPFLTPFGTPVAVGILHSLLYWALLIGICNHVTYFVATDLQAGTWGVLRTTPYTTSELLLVKLAVIGRIWVRVLRILLITRGIALLMIPLSSMASPGAEITRQLALDGVGGLIFLVQPMIDTFMVASLSLLSAMLVPGLMWAKIGGYALSALFFGALHGLGGLWLIYESPLGTLGGLLVPLGHWAPLASALTPPASSPEILARTVMLVAVYAVGPLLVGLVAFRLAARLGCTHA